MSKFNKGWIKGKHTFSYFKSSKYALLLEWKKAKDPKTNFNIRSCLSQIEDTDLTGITEMVPAYHSAMIYFNSRLTNHDKLIQSIEDLYKPIESKDITNNDIKIIEVNYGFEFGPDLDFVSTHTGLSVEKIIEIHSTTIYDLHFIGFLPGFLYLGGLDKRLDIPRRATPRIRVPSGSVALAAGQTGVYPSDSPGGWHIIGRTEQSFFNPHLNPPTEFEPGMKIKFQVI